MNGVSSPSPSWSRRKFLLPLPTGIFVVVALLLPQPLRAFNLDLGASWSSVQTVPIRVQLGQGPQNQSVLLDGYSSFDQSALQAMRLWNHYIVRATPLLTPTVFPVGSGTPDVGGRDSITTLYFSSMNFGQAWPPRVLAVTQVQSVGNVMTSDDIDFNATLHWDSYRGNPIFGPSPGFAPVYDFQRIAIHELGHLLGLDHPDQETPSQFVNAIMNSTIGALDIMADDDIQGINVLYNGAPIINGNTSTPGTLGTVTNLSTRLNVGVNASQAFPGFLVTGTGTKRVLVRAIGPSLTQFGIQGALQAPTMDLHSASMSIATNTGWKTRPQAEQDAMVAANQQPQFDAECAILMDLPASAAGTGYTAIVGGVGGSTGVGRVDVIDLDPTDTAAKLTNVSTRGQVQTGANVMIGGFILGGTLPKQIWIRAVGPSLANSGVQGTIPDPTLTIVDSGGNQVYVNNDWQSAQSQMIQGSTIQPGNVKEAAVMINLPPGAYTVVVSGVGGVTGNGRVDIYDGDNTPFQ